MLLKGLFDNVKQTDGATDIAAGLYSAALAHATDQDVAAREYEPAVFRGINAAASLKHA